ncbi:MAG: class I SAM-dependent methyltransferase [Sedimentisphaerales bacterium]|nr:class I SAM-dependent methyltransferase [Sedimentisphaerales bacterium]
MSKQTLLTYYQTNQFNPVPIEIGDDRTWRNHFTRRRNLYENHLGIPLALLRDKSVLEFGCNSGENALVLAAMGANLTLVEPNEQVWPRLHQLFDTFKLKDRIINLFPQDINTFESDNIFDLVLAEGFIHTLENRDQALSRLLSYLAPGGIGIISFDDRFGSLLECIRQLLLFRVLELQGISDPHCDKSRQYAEQLFGQDYARLHTSRPFESWWKDNLVNPFFSAEVLWSYREILEVITQSGGEFLSSSPKWFTGDHYTWYKQVCDPVKRHHVLLQNWEKVFTYMLTGLLPEKEPTPLSPEILACITHFIEQISQYVHTRQVGVEELVYPEPLEVYLEQSSDLQIQYLNLEMKTLIGNIIRTTLKDELINAYHETSILKLLWGCPYHYISFTKSS